MNQKEVLYKTSTASDGNMSFRFGDTKSVLENRRQFVEKLHIPTSQYVCMACNHGEKITTIYRSTDNTANRYFDARSQEDMIESEVLVTKEKGLALMLLTADCIPGVFYDPLNKVIALAHLNRKTIAHDLAQKTVSVLSEQFGSLPEDLLVYFGPYITKDSYRFPLPLTEPTPTQLTPHIEERDGFAYIDMLAAEKAQLEHVGVRTANISVSDIDTATSKHHFSHYRSVRDTSYPEGRLATIVALV